MDHPPKEMKETLFTKHNQTVVPFLTNPRKASLQAVHTSFVNTAIDNMADNRVLNYRPPPINDETTTGHSITAPLRPLQALELLQKETRSSSCPDCGMDPQDVPHLFNCTAHPTALTPENLWDRPVVVCHDQVRLQVSQGFRCRDN